MKQPVVAPSPAVDLPKRHPQQLFVAAGLWLAWLAFLAVTAFSG